MFQMRGPKAETAPTMPIRTNCSSCGKKLRIRDDYLGRKVKCPECGNVFLAEADEDATAVQAEPPKPAPAKAAKEKVAVKPPKRTVPPPDDRDDESEDRPIKRGKKRAKSQRRFSPLVLGSAAAVLLIALLAGGYFLFFSSPTPAKKGGGLAQKSGNQNKGREALHAPTATEATLADLVPGDAWFFVSASFDWLDHPALAMFRQMVKPMEDEFHKHMGFPLSDLERVSVFPVGDFAALKNNPLPPIVFVVQTKKPMNQQAVLAALQKADKPGEGKVEFLTDRMLFTTPQAALAAYEAKKGQQKATGVLERALTQVNASKALVASVVVPPEAAKEAAAGAKGVPDMAALARTRELLVSVDLGDRFVLNATLVGDSAQATQEIKNAADRLVGSANQFLTENANKPEMAQMVNMGQKMLKDLKLGAQDKEMTIAFQGDTVQSLGLAMGVIMPAIAKVRSAAGNLTEVNNLKQIGLAWHNYASVYKTFPPQTFNKGLSWRVAILPFIEEDALYKQFKLNEPWNSPHNLKLLTKMPKVYESTGRPAGPGFTFYQTFVGPKTANKNPLQGSKMTDFLDGTSNTLIVAEAAAPVAWTKPDDIKVMANLPVLVGSADPNFFLGLFADATVQRLPRTLDQNSLHGLIDPADGKGLLNLNTGGKK
jgi:hypothetical protein